MTTSGNLSRRQFLRQLARRSFIPGVLAGGMIAGYATYETKRCTINRVELAPRNLPPSFDGMTIAFIADTHHGPLNPLDHINHAVDLTNALRPDLVLLGGDYVERHRAYTPGGNHRHYIDPGVAALARLNAPMGRFAVLGNHDYMVNAALTRRALAKNGLVELTNRGVWLERGGARLRVCGFDDYHCGRPRQAPALGEMTAQDAAICFTHNPDLVESIRDPRVDLVLSGHTHGGQIVLPFIGAPVTASDFGQKYLQGLRQGPSARVFVSRGVGTIGLPFRLACPPEVVLITLRAPAAA